MRDRGAYNIPGDTYRPYERPVDPSAVDGCEKDASGVFRKPNTEGTWNGDAASLGQLHLAKLGDGSPAIEVDGELKEGFPTPSKKLELSTTLNDWGWPEYATPKWIPAMCTGKTSISMAMNECSYLHSDEPSSTRAGQLKMAQRDFTPSSAASTQVM